MFMIWVVSSRISRIFSILALDSLSALGEGGGEEGAQGSIHTAFSQGCRQGELPSRGLS